MGSHRPIGSSLPLRIIDGSGTIQTRMILQGMWGAVNRMSRAAQILSVWAVFLVNGSRAQDPAPPLPEFAPFLKEMRMKLHSDRTLLCQYTYTERNIEKTLDEKGGVKKTDEEVSEIYPSMVSELSYRRLIMRNGKPVPAKELEKRDREHDKKLEEHKRRLEREGKSAREERLAKEAEEKRKEEAAIDELFQLYELKMLRRDILGEQSAILIEFSPRSGFKPKTDVGKVLKKVAGRAWVSENDHEVIRIEAELIDDYTIGGGILARLNRGATISFQRRKINGEIWLPDEAHFRGSARIMLFKGMRVDATIRYSDYMKFTVETNIIYRRKFWGPAAQLPNRPSEKD
jgi:hypothetical protein